MPVELRIVRDRHRARRTEHRVVFEDHDPRRTRRHRFPDPIVVSVEIEAEEIGLAGASVGGDQIVDVLACHPGRHCGDRRKTPAHLRHVIGVAIDHQPRPPALTREESRVAAAQAGSDFDEPTLAHPDFAQEDERESIFLVLRAEAEAASGQSFGIGQHIGVEIACSQ